MKVPSLFNLFTVFGKATIRRRSPGFGCRNVLLQPVFIRRQHLLPWLACRFSRVSSVLGKLGGLELHCHIPRHTARSPRDPARQTSPADRLMIMSLEAQFERVK